MSDPVELILAAECPRHGKDPCQGSSSWDAEPWFCASRIRAALSPEAPKPTRVPRGHCNRCDYCGWELKLMTGLGCVAGSCSMRPLPKRRDTCAGCGAPFETPKPAQAATCPEWCGEPHTLPNAYGRHGKQWCNTDCADAGRPLHPATEQAATCGTCGGTKREVFMFSHGQTIDEPCPDCGGTGRR